MGINVEHLIHEYGCAIVFAFALLQALGAPLPGTTALVAAALYASSHRGLPIVWVIASAAAGAFLGTSGGYLVGRRGGEPLLHRLGARLRQPPERIDRVRAAIAANAGRFLFFGRFITGVRNALGLVAGAGGVAPRRFVPVCAAASLAWAGINGIEYYAFGHALQSADTWIQVVLVAIGVAWLAVSLRWLRRKALAV